jgi:hypothetical protein
VADQWDGDVVILREDRPLAPGVPTECETVLVVQRADPRSKMSLELYGQLDRKLVHIDGDVVTFGTPGRGLGVVSYRLTPMPLPADYLLMERITQEVGDVN